MARLPLPPSGLLIARTNMTAYVVIVEFTCMHVVHCHFGDSSKLESRGIFKTHPPEETLEDHSSAESPNGSVPSYFKAWKRRCGAQWDNLRLQATIE